MVPYDVQLIGGMALHEGKVAEMATGEGKTLVATMPLYLNALAGRGAHLVTVNSYLAQRDSEWMGHLYRFLGLTVGLHRPARARHAGASRRLPGRHHLRHQQRVRLRLPPRQHGAHAGAAGAAEHYYAIIDEVDSVLIDEARTPLIISGPVASETNTAYARYNPLVSDLYRRQNRIVGDLIGEAERAHRGGRRVHGGREAPARQARDAEEQAAR